MPSRSSILLLLLALAAVSLTVRYVDLKGGDKHHWELHIPTGADDDRCVGLTRSQYVPFWCVVGLLTAAFYALPPLCGASARSAISACLRGRVSWVFGGKAVWGGNRVGLKASLLEVDDGSAAVHAGTLVEVDGMQRLCDSLGHEGGLWAASLAVFVALQKRKTYGGGAVAASPEGGRRVTVDVQMTAPEMKFSDLLAATEDALKEAAPLGEDETPEAAFAWGPGNTVEPGEWRVHLASGNLVVKGSSAQEELSYKLLFEACAGAPDSSVWEMPVMLKAALEQVQSWGSPCTDMGAYRTSSGAIQTFPELFVQSPAPDGALAVAGEGFQLTYEELRRRVAAIARAVRNEASAAVGRSQARDVVVYMGRGEAVAPAFFGVLHAGHVVVPIDTHWPAERVQTVVADSAATLALTDPASQGAWALMPGLPKSLVVDQALFQMHEACLDLPEAMAADDPAITLFTSGSTGKPKGIILSHAYVMTLAVGRAESLQMAAATRTLLHQSPTWMPFIDYLFGPMIKGGCCVLVPEPTGSHAVTPASLRALVQKHGATILGFVPPVLDIFLDEDLPPTLNCVCVGGAAVPADLCRRTASAFGKHRDGVRRFLATGYHGTEQGDVTQIQVSSDADVERFVSAKGFMTSGRPHTTQRCAVLDQGMQPVGPGGVGEITVCGPGLASGYLNLPDKTAETFIRCALLGPGTSMRTSDLGRWTPSGSLEVVGRRDSMVKVRGARVELGEVEAAISCHPDVRACIVVVHEDRLVAYVSPAVPGNLRDLCKTRLASYMVPHVFEGLEALPQLANGKINKKALPPPSAASADGSETVVELDSLGQMRKLTRTSASEDRILDNVRAILMTIVIQSHATPLVAGSLAMQDLARAPVDAEWSQASYLLLTVSRCGGWSALAYMAGFDDTRGDSPYRLTYREGLFVALWVLSGFKWTLWFLPAFVYMRVFFVLAHRFNLMRLHMVVLSQIWLTVPAFVDWYVGWLPSTEGQQQDCPSQCFCPFQGRLWAESIAYYTLGMWTVGPANVSHSFVGRALFFVPCYWLGFYTGRWLFRFLVKINDEFSCRLRLVTAAAAIALYSAFFTKGSWIEAGFDDRCGSFWDDGSFVWAQIAKNVAYFSEGIATSFLYVVFIVAALPIHLKRLAKTCFAAYVLAAFAPFFCLVDLPVMAVEIRKAADPAVSPLLETIFIFLQPAIYVMAVGSLMMWLVQVMVKALRSII